MAEKEKAPGLGSAGAKLWATLMAEFEEVGPHERVLLVELCRTADTLAALQAAVDKEGVTVRTSFEDIRPHPLLAEQRLQRATFAHLVKALKLPVGVEADRAVLPARRTRFELRAVAPGLA